MRVPSFPPCVIDRRGAWRWAVAAIVAASAASAVAWLVAHLGGSPFAPAAAAALAAGGLALAATRLAPLELAFDGDRWVLGGHAGGGRLDVVMDIGAWMLLRYVADDARAGERWLPVSRRRLGARWHALRCAAWGGGPDTAADGSAA